MPFGVLRMQRIYLDHNATTPIHPEVVEAMMPFLRGVYGNPSSLHAFGQEARRAVERAREQVADFVGADPSEIVFTSGGTEGNNLALRGALPPGASGRIVTSAVEHPAVLNPVKDLASRGADVEILPVDGTGLVSVEAFDRACGPGTTLASVMLANNDVGTIEPVAELAALARKHRVVFHTDAVQAAGKIPVNVRALGVDLLTLSAHKFYGPKGVGALFLRKGTRIAAQLFGGAQERGRRAGTENVPAIVGMGAAAAVAARDLAASMPSLEALRDRLQRGLETRAAPVLVNGHPGRRLPNTLNATFPDVEGEALLLNLDLKGIAVSTGSACSSGSVDPSHVLLAMGRSRLEAQGSIRFSVGRGNTDAEMDVVVEAVAEVVARLRGLAPRRGGA